jgi:predicted  nucleic acid-binding Zn-ribbon protein
MSSRIQSLEAENSALKEQLASVVKQADHVEATSVPQLELESTVENLKLEITNLRGHLEEAENRFTTAAVELSEEKTKNGVLAKEKAILENEMLLLREQASDGALVSEKCLQQEETLRQLTVARDALQVKADELGSELEKATCEVQRLTKENDGLKEDVDRLEDELRDQSSFRSDFEHRIAYLETENARLAGQEEQLSMCSAENLHLQEKV